MLVNLGGRINSWGDSTLKGDLVLDEINTFKGANMKFAPSLVLMDLGTKVNKLDLKTDAKTKKGSNTWIQGNHEFG